MTTFGLVHGAWHGAWCWERLGAELRRRGHDVVAPDLPIDDVGAGFSAYADVIVDSLGEGADDTVLVAHSMAGLSVPIAASRLGVRAVVLLCALIAEPGRSLIDQILDQPDMLVAGYDAGIEQDDQGRSRWVDPDAARAVFYGDCDPAAARAAFDRLRPQAQGAFGEPCPLTALPDVEWGYVLGAQDRILNPEWSRQAAATRLGVTPIELPGSHSPFLSRPADLADVLERFA